MSQQQPTIGRPQFIKDMVRRGFTYVQAANAYTSMMDTVADGMVNNSKVCLGNVGVLVPQLRPPRKTVMNFRSLPGGGKEAIYMEYNLGIKRAYRLKIYKKFSETHLNSDPMHSGQKPW